MELYEESAHRFHTGRLATRKSLPVPPPGYQVSLLSLKVKTVPNGRERSSVMVNRHQGAIVVVDVRGRVSQVLEVDHQPAFRRAGSAAGRQQHRKNDDLQSTYILQMTSPFRALFMFLPHEIGLGMCISSIHATKRYSAAPTTSAADPAHPPHGPKA